MKRCRWCGGSLETHESEICRWRFGRCLICGGEIDHAKSDWFTAGRGGQNAGNSGVHIACYVSEAGAELREKEDELISKRAIDRLREIESDKERE